MKHALFTVPLQYSRADDISKVLKKLPEEVEAYEVWIDQFIKRDLVPEKIVECVQEWKALSQKKLVVVCKDPAEKGKYRGLIELKQQLLTAAAQSGADFIDIGLHHPQAVIEELRRSKRNAQLILSYHDFEKTPEEQDLQKLVKKMKDLQPDVLKLATMVHDPTDTERLMELAVSLEKKQQAHIILGMGQLGVTTRIFSDQIGNTLNFVTLESKTAPGQLSLEQALQFRKVIE